MQTECSTGIETLRNEGPDLIADFNAAVDKFALVDSLKYSQLLFDDIQGGAINGVPLNLPDFLGFGRGINSGTRIRQRTSGEVLACVDGPLSAVVNRSSLFNEVGGMQLPSPV
ncbi:MAG: hypothetical protein HC886_22970 [Leptolyngbyaceae cyanobacterium SM1_1_3]|nr:hypothetical protein [Leptolyngbyaceae cyanobacterium SM1_1_3]NJM85071.1 hypothetical protein [Leptolyngbyaceae cyanobacterium RM2_2_21]NJN03366.1 hypothetical protein [Leptolyngbyaceae cyanobacterium RM1_1_2]NJO11813.1 hypothetical protein [Leptolyngbyaceae cyanobacterium SL_1_1]